MESAISNTTSNLESGASDNLNHKPPINIVHPAVSRDFETILLGTMLLEHSIKYTSNFFANVSNALTLLEKVMLSDTTWVTFLDYHIRKLPQHMHTNIIEVLERLTQWEWRYEQTLKPITTANIFRQPAGALTDVRLLVLHPSSDDASIVRCTLCKHHLQVGNLPDYEVLSYAWKDRTRASRIKLNGNDRQIAGTLESALRLLRHSNRPRVLWLDTLCVRHSDQEEVYKIVADAKAIYTQAKRVIVWLGKESSTSKKASSFVKEFATVIVGNRGDKSNGASHIANQLGRLVHDPIHTSSWEAVLHLLHRSWWSRAEIMDELIGPHAVMRSGNDSTEWHIFRCFFAGLHWITSEFKKRSVELPGHLADIMRYVPLNFFNYVTEAGYKKLYDFSVTFVDALSFKLTRLASDHRSEIDWIKSIGPLLSTLSIKVTSRYFESCLEEFEPSILKQRDRIGSFGMEKEISQQSVINALRKEYCRWYYKRSEEAGFEEVVQRLESEGIAFNGMSANLKSTNDIDNNGADLRLWLLLLTALGDREQEDRGEQAFIAKAASKTPLKNKDDTTASTCDKEETHDYSLINNGVYSYRCLKHPNQQIRVLVLYPSDDLDSPIYCDLITADLTQLSELGINRYPYMALSYVWGKTEPRRTIFIRGMQKEVGPNLFAVLLQLRHPHEPSLLWIDALCINQDSAEERNHQIGLMRSIYANAGKVLVWLGEERDETCVAMGTLYLLNLQLSMLNYDIDIEFQHLFLKLLQDYTSTRCILALEELFSRPYWTRVWTVQEMLLSNDATLCCGRYAVDFKVIMALFKFLGYTPFTNLLAMATSRMLVGGLVQMHAILTSGSTGKMLDIFLLGRGRSATNKLDFIYGFLGLVSLSGGSLVPDYDKPLLSICIDLFRLVTQMDGNLDALSVRRNFDRYNSPKQYDDEAWSSWVPDWTYEDFRYGLRAESMLLTDKGRGCYHAAGESKPRFSIQEQDRILSIEGFVFDTVQFVCTMSWPDSAKENWMSILQRVRNVQPLDKLQLAFAETTFLGQLDDEDINEKAEEKLGFAFSEILDGHQHMTADFDANAASENTRDVSNNHTDKQEHQPEHQGIFLGSYSLTPPSVDRSSGRVNEEAAYETKVDSTTDEYLTAQDMANHERAKRYMAELMISRQCSNYDSRFFITSRGYFGRGPLPTRKGDIVSIFLGANVPFMLRKQDLTGNVGIGQASVSTDLYRLLGESCE
jgi:hypothetical protein